MCLLEALHDQLLASTAPTLINFNMILINDKYFKSLTSPMLTPKYLLHKKIFVCSLASCGGRQWTEL